MAKHPRKPLVLRREVVAILKNGTTKRLTPRVRIARTLRKESRS